MDRKQERAAWLEALRSLPAEARAAVRGLDAGQLATSYREGGWTVLQLVHHLADAHVNGYARFRLTLTEQRPVLRPYDQDAWAGLPDAASGPLEESLDLLAAVHARTVRLIEAQPEDVWARVALHPEVGALSFEDLLRTYAEHGRHHLEQITGLRSARGW